MQMIRAQTRAEKRAATAPNTNATALHSCDISSYQNVNEKSQALMPEIDCASYLVFATTFRAGHHQDLPNAMETDHLLRSTENSVRTMLL